MNITTKNSPTNLGKSHQQHIKILIHHSGAHFRYPGVVYHMQINVIYHNKKIQKAVLTDAEKAFSKSQHSLKTLNKLGIEGTYLKIIRATYDKPTVRIILDSEKLKGYPLRPVNRTKMSTHFCTVQHSHGIE